MASPRPDTRRLGHDWVRPHWLHGQLDPDAPSFTPRGHLPVLTNITGRNWTMVGNVGSTREGVVDPRGLVMPWFDGWSLDWWIGAEDRWHFPSQEQAVRQSLVGDAPVVETAMRVPGGDAVQRVYAVPGAGQAGELIVVEIENRSATPFAVALAVRPYNPEGLAVIERIAIHDRTVVVDGRPALMFAKPPARMAGSTFHDGDVAEIVTAGQAGSSLPTDLRCDVGLAQAAFLFPLAHGAIMRAAMPLHPQHRTRRRRLAARRTQRLPALPTNLPSSEDVSRGWEAQARRGMRLELPDGALARAVEANRRFMLLFHDGDEITPGPFTYHRFWFRDAAFLLATMDRYGFSAEAAEVLRSYPQRQHSDGFFFSQRQEWDANGCALYAMAEHWRLTRDQDLLAALAPSVARATRWIERKRRPDKRRRDPALRGMLPASISAEHLGPFDYFYWDNFWGVKGMEDGALLLRAAGLTEEADAATDAAAAFRSDLMSSLAVVADRLGTAAMPAGPRRRIDAGVIGSLVACWPLGLMAADDPAITATADVIRDRFCHGDAIFSGISHTGLGTYLTLQLAFVELEAGDRRALDRLQWLVGAATPTWTWPAAIHPQLGSGCMGDGHHGWAAADFLAFVRQLLIRDVGEDTLALCTMLPATWEGQPLEVHDAPTRLGKLSYAVRWHGSRPALLWELVPHPGVETVRITAPGLDSSWSSSDLKGDALLGSVPVAGGSGSFS